MNKTVLDVGNCAPDHANLSRLLKGQFGVEVLQTHAAADTLEILRSRPIQLVLINRKLDQDYSDGVEIIMQIKADPLLASIPLMLLSNYPEHQEAAVALGAAYGFGKLQFSDPMTYDRLAEFLA